VLTIVPAKHDATGLHSAALSVVEKVPSGQGEQTRSEVMVASCATNSPGMHTVCSVHCTTFAAVENEDHCAGTATSSPPISLAPLPPLPPSAPASASAALSRHAAHSRSVDGVGSTKTNSPAKQSVIGVHASALVSPVNVLASHRVHTRLVVADAAGAVATTWFPGKHTPQASHSGAFASSANVPASQAAHSRSSAGVGTSITWNPGWQLATGVQAAAFSTVEKSVPATQLLQVRSLLNVGSTTTCCPEEHTACTSHATWSSTVENVPGLHAPHSRSVDGVGSTVTCSPGWHDTTAVHSGWLAADENVPDSHALQTRLAVALPSSYTWLPASQTVHASQAASLLANVNSPSLHGAHSRSEFPVGALVT